MKTLLIFFAGAHMVFAIMHAATGDGWSCLFSAGMVAGCLALGVK